MQVQNTRPALIHIAGIGILPGTVATIPSQHEKGVRESGVFKAGWLQEIGAAVVAPNINAGTLIAVVGEMKDVAALTELLLEEDTSPSPRKLVQSAIRRRLEDLAKPPVR